MALDTSKSVIFFPHAHMRISPEKQGIKLKFFFVGFRSARALANPIRSPFQKKMRSAREQPGDCNCFVIPDENSCRKKNDRPYNAGPKPTEIIRRMTMQPHTVTRLIQDWREGDASALDRLFPLVYDELHCRAKASMRREHPGQTLQPTALVHEVYLRLAGESDLELTSRNDLFVVCANLMRHVLVDIARTKCAAKRGGHLRRVSLAQALDVVDVVAVSGRDLLALDEALRRLERLNSRQSRVVALRYFGGLSIEQTAIVMEVSPDTVKRDWRLARVWLLRELGQRAPETVARSERPERNEDFRTR
jgi:RNA polymerase sigma-70 factor, ECF subfamily